MTEQENIRELARLLNVTTDNIRHRIESGAIRDLETWTPNQLQNYVRACAWANGEKHTAITVAVGGEDPK